MAKIPENANLIEILSSKKKVDIKKISQELYSKNVTTFLESTSKGVVLKVHLKNVVKSILIASRVIQGEEMTVEFLNKKYWETHAPELFKVVGVEV